MPRYAAVDIGSNSVRMMAAEVGQGPTRILAQDRQVTRLGESVFRSGKISEEALVFLCAQLARMSAIYNNLDVRGVRAVATSAVRDASNQRSFCNARAKR
jgi:exopolyphosphatase / guanosine-5'-triphosphate,3'-diphosphate pyrophosphatase